MRPLFLGIKFTTTVVISVIAFAEILSSDRTCENKKIKEELNMTEEKMETAMERMGNSIYFSAFLRSSSFVLDGRFFLPGLWEKVSKTSERLSPLSWRHKPPHETSRADR